jgi:hypothetical protein
MKQVLRDAQGRILWTNDPERPDAKASGTGSSPSPWRSQPRSPERDENAPDPAEEREHLRTFAQFANRIGRRR